jgi:SAM-dependent methyltransferase
MLAVRVARGIVVDCACGIGYSSEIVCRKDEVGSYLGIDPSEDAIEYARKNYADGRIRFEIGTLEANSCLDSSVDTYLMFETLEHTATPELALANVRRCLKPDGLLIGSVPSADYEALCEQTYGANPYHLQRFSKERIAAMLGEHFESVRLFSAEFVLGTLFRSAERDAGDQSDVLTGKDDMQGIVGSIIFLAGTLDRVVEAIRALGAPNKFFLSTPKVIFDRDEVEPIRKAFHLTESALIKRDKSLETQARMLEERWAAMQSMDAMVHERDEAIARQARMLEERWAAMQSMDAMVRERDGAIARQARMLEERWAAMQSMEATIAMQRQVNEAQSAMLAATVNKFSGKSLLGKLSSGKNDAIPFRDLAFSLYLFTERLYAASMANGSRDLFFFAREGQQLKEMFDFYQVLNGGNSRIRTHYLRLSRRSTFLLSLGPLAEENFEVLFRQYCRISVLDFLKSLDLEEYAPELANELGIEEHALASVSSDLPSDDLFQNLLRLPSFSRVYEAERLARGDAFERYVSSFVQNGGLPNVLHVVDVGWKGSIQDNLYNWFRRRMGSKSQIEGYYLGLVATGAMSNANRKTGLLFSNVHGRTRGFHLFNENRSLFEIILHADHGSARRYLVESDGAPRVVEDEFTENEMIAAKVRPVSGSIMELFRRIAVAKFVAQISDSDLFQLTAKRHSRMVFRPSGIETDWFFSVSHVENFGVFEESSFGSSDAGCSSWDRARFSWNVLCRRRPSELGFWPWLSIRARGLAGLSSMYALVRRWQSL